jgi:uncharacterized protein YfaT (DUF1175 family)
MTNTPAVPQVRYLHGVPAGYRGIRAVNFALRQQGKPYLYGQAGPEAYDCSGLVLAAWQFAGIDSLYHQSEWMYQNTDNVFGKHLGPLLPGDLVFYYGNAQRGRLPHHVALFVGWNQNTRWVVQATQPGTPLELIPMRHYANPSSFGRVHGVDHIAGGKRVEWEPEL